jgi:hypothetical protein
MIFSVSVDSTPARRLPPEERVVPLDYPIRLSPDTDLNRLRKDITNGQRGIARDVDAKPDGGNNHQRIRISIALNNNETEPLMVLGPLVVTAKKTRSATLRSVRSPR